MSATLLANLVLNVGSVWAGGGGGESAQHGMPFSYVVAWLVLLFVLALGWWSYKKRCQSAHAAETEGHAPATHSGGIVPVLLMLAVAFLFLTESLSAMGSYHEPFLLGLPRFVLKIGGGVLLMFYGLSFMHGHDEH